MLFMHVILMNILTSHDGLVACRETGSLDARRLGTCLTRSRGPSRVPDLRLGAPVLVTIWSSWRGGAGQTPLLATAFDLRVLFTIVAKAAGRVCVGEVLGFLDRAVTPIACAPMLTVITIKEVVWCPVTFFPQEQVDHSDPVSP
jgi:hypothetical protein